MNIQRREVLRIAAAVPMVAWLGKAAAGAFPVRELFVYDHKSMLSLMEAPRRGGRTTSGSLVKVLPVDADWVRFARECLATAPVWIHGVLCPASFLVLTGAAEEEGYRMCGERWLRSGQAAFSMQHRSRRA
jgi:hypothetical protein